MDAGAQNYGEVIYVPAGVKAKLTLNGATINAGASTAPITVAGELELTLQGKNTLNCYSFHEDAANNFNVIQTPGIFVLPNGKLTINGTDIAKLNITANDGATAIGGSYGYDGNTGEIIINGGSVKNTVVNNRPTDGTNDLYMTTVTLSGAASPTAVTDIKYYIKGTETTYGIGNAHAYKNMQTDSSGNLYLWLPKDAIISSVKADSKIYYGSLWVTDDDAASETFVTVQNTYDLSAAANDTAKVDFFTGSTAAPGMKVYIKVTIQG